MSPYNFNIYPVIAALSCIMETFSDLFSWSFCYQLFQVATFDFHVATLDDLWQSVSGFRFKNIPLLDVSIYTLVPWSLFLDNLI